MEPLAGARDGFRTAQTMIGPGDGDAYRCSPATALFAAVILSGFSIRRSGEWLLPVVASLAGTWERELARFGARGRRREAVRRAPHGTCRGEGMSGGRVRVLQRDDLSGGRLGRT